MFGIVVWLSLSVAPAPSNSNTSERVKLVVLPVRAYDDTLKRRAEELGELALTELARDPGLEPHGLSDIASQLSLEKQRQVLGCTDESKECLAEIGGALGAPYLVVASVGRAGKLLRVDVKLLPAAAGEVLLRAGEVLESEDDFYPVVIRLLKSVALAVPRKAGARALAPSTSPGPWVLGGVGLAASLGGAWLMVGGSSEARAALASKTQANVTVVDINARYDAARTTWGAGAGLVGVGVVAMAVATVWKVRDSSPAVVVVPRADGFAVACGGTF